MQAHAGVATRVAVWSASQFRTIPLSNRGPPARRAQRSPLDTATHRGGHATDRRKGHRAVAVTVCVCTKSLMTSDHVLAIYYPAETIAAAAMGQLHSRLRRGEPTPSLHPVVRLLGHGAQDAPTRQWAAGFAPPSSPVLKQRAGALRRRLDARGAPVPSLPAASPRGR